MDFPRGASTLPEAIVGVIEDAAKKIRQAFYMVLMGSFIDVLHRDYVMDLFM